MITVKKHVYAVALGVLALASPFSAKAGTSTSTGTVSILINPGGCEIAGANIDLGVFQANQTWRNVGERLGYISESRLWVQGSQGDRYVSFGKILCDLGMPYTLAMTGSGAGPDEVGGLSINNAVRMMLREGPAVYLIPFVRTLDGVEVPHPQDLNGMGKAMVNGATVSGVGTAQLQEVRGHFTMGVKAPGASSPGLDSPGLDDRITQTGVLSDTLTYTLTF